MGKYEPLSNRLQREPKDSWTTTFRQVEEVLGFPLPQSARNYREWWANQKSGSHSQAKGWQDAGWQVWKVDLKEETVTFRRLPYQPPFGHSPSPELVEQALFERASAYLGINDRQQLIREAMEALCEREAARRLSRLGGTMPDLQAPPRRRFG